MLYILIPAYNEEENLNDLFKNISKYFTQEKKIVIVNDGSFDETGQIIKTLAKKYSIISLGYIRNRGLGYAFKFGLDYILKSLKENDRVLTLEADNTTDYQLFKKLLAKSRDYDVIVTSPHRGKFIGVSRWRTFMSRAATVVDSLIFRIDGVTTHSSFYRLYSGKILKKLKKKFGEKYLVNHDFSSVVEILIKMKKCQATFYELPSTVNWEKRKGESKMKISKNIASHFKLYREYFLGKLG